MKVVILHQHFKTPQSGGAIRSYYLARALVERKISVVVITADNRKEYTITEVEGVEVHYLPIAYDNTFRFLKRSWAFIRYIFLSFRAVKEIKGISHCYCISTPLTTGITALWIKQRLSIPYYFEVGDLWPEAPIQMGYIKGKVVKAWLYWLERKIYDSAVGVIALSLPIEEAIKKVVPDQAIFCIPNMADTEYFSREEKDETLVKKFKTKGKFVVSYVGALGKANGLEFLIGCAKNAQEKNLPIHFLVCGTGAKEPHLKAEVNHLGLENISFVGFLNREEVKEVFNVTDAAFICYKRVPILETGSPNKFFDGLAGGKLILINVGGWIKEEIEKNRCGVYLNRADTFDKTIFPFLESPELLAEYQKASRELGERKYSRKQLSREFAQLFEDKEKA